MTISTRCRFTSTMFLKPKRGVNGGGEGRGRRWQGERDFNNPQHSLYNKMVIFLGVICIGRSNSFVN